MMLSLTFATSAEADTMKAALAARLQVRLVCDCPLHNPEARHSGAGRHPVCPCTSRTDVDQACPHLHRWRVGVYQHQTLVWVLPVGPVAARLGEVASDLVDIDAVAVDLTPPGLEVP